ncbi:helix-turn-helix domain-containing protein [Paucibacter sp. APW11]|uniref:Helix-turn-helix domain-containing protein n=1 Tax=Roseateles aquae TaxID=3077235 RepID=A0ABU3PDC8_9BURK|nr:helix-turn-helix domain-containing protein [Paucibacter sp. APW11]MDT9000581.1 helix-turn-helix domain-containing protein [Paucibacter sp. APW11]
MSQIDVLMLVEPGSLLLDLAGPAEAFRLANQALQRRGEPPAFRLRFIAAQPEAESSVGLQLAGLEPLPDTLPASAWLMLVGCRHRRADEPEPDSAQIAAALRTERWLAAQGQVLLASGGRLLSICSGALLAARAGLMRGRRCTTHHELLDELRHAAPETEVVDNRVFVVDGPVASSAGITAGIDLCLHLIAQHCGDAIGAAVAQTMVVYLRRSPQDPELSPMLAHRNHLHPALHRAQDAICADPRAEWSLDRLAALAHVTPRHLSRLFASHAGTTALHYLQAIRLERARKVLATGATLGQAAELAGFSSEQQLRRARRASQAS